MNRPLTALTMAAGVALSACGGGSQEDAGRPFICQTCDFNTGSAGGSGSPAGNTPTPSTGTPGTGSGALEGYWTGPAGPYEFGAVALPDGALYVAYTRAGVLYGVIAGTASSSAGAFTAAVTDFNAPLAAITAGTASGTYTGQGNLSATVKIGSATTYAFDAAYDGSYDTAANLAQFAGVWTGTSGSRSGATTATASLGADGTFTGATPFCAFSGTAAPYSAGKHPLRINVRFNGVSCPLAGKTATGVAVVRQIAGIQQLLTFGQTADRSDFFFSLGRR